MLYVVFCSDGCVIVGDVLMCPIFFSFFLWCSDGFVPVLMFQVQRS